MTTSKYVGFWARLWTSIIDAILIALITIPLLIGIYGSDAVFLSERFILGPADFLVSYVFPCIAVIVFWTHKQATPGKMAISAKIVDAETGA